MEVQPLEKKIYKTKLKISKKQETLFKQMAGVYRKAFNLGIDMQDFRVTFSNHNPSEYFISGTQLLKCMKEEEKHRPYMSTVDCGIVTRATFNSNLSFKRWYNLYTIGKAKTRLPKYLSRKKDIPHFGTSTPLKVFHDHIEIPKVGKVSLYERGYIPQGKKYSNASFSYDGKNWWITLEVQERVNNVEPLTDRALTLSLERNGDLTLNDSVISNVINSENYLKQKAKHKKLMKKYKRQALNNSIITTRTVVRTSRGMMKTRKALLHSSKKLENIKKDYFRKKANEVARTKPKEIRFPSFYLLRQKYQGLLTHCFRESDTAMFLSMLRRKLRLQGTRLIGYHSSAELLTS